MNEIITMNYEGRQVRTIIDENGDPWWVAKDICKILDYSDAEAVTRRLDDDEKQNRQIVGFSPRGVTVVNESGLYNAILGSNKPQAKFFKKWVTSEVLPSIRKTGIYGDPAACLNDPVELRRLLLRYAEKTMVMQEEIAAGKEREEEAAAKAATILKAGKIIDSELRSCKKLGIGVKAARARAVASARAATGIDYGPLLPQLSGGCLFISECCEIGEEYSVPAVTLYGAYMRWALRRTNDEAIMSQTRFNEYLKGEGVRKIRPRISGRRVTVMSGIRIKG